MRRLQRAGAATTSTTSSPTSPRGGGRETRVLRPVGRAAATAARGGDLQVHLVVPKSFNDAQQIADQFKDSIPVILNLQGTDTDLSKRLIDFSSGLTYALDGGMQRIADKVFLLTPRNVEVSAEERARLIEKGFFNQSVAPSCAAARAPGRDAAGADRGGEHGVRARARDRRAGAGVGPRLATRADALAEAVGGEALDVQRARWRSARTPWCCATSRKQLERGGGELTGAPEGGRLDPGRDDHRRSSSAPIPERAGLPLHPQHPGRGRPGSALLRARARAPRTGPSGSCSSCSAAPAP